MIDEAGVRVRDVQPRDALRVFEIQSAADATELSLLRRLVANAASKLLVAETSRSTVVGFLVYWLVIGEDFRVVWLVTHPDFRRRGVAHRLMDAARERGRRNRCGRLILEVHPSNRGAIGFYRGVGMVPAGVRPDYYRDGTGDAIQMSLDLGSI